MLSEEEKKTLGLFGYASLVSLVIVIVFKIFELRMKDIFLNSSIAKIPILLLLVVMNIFIISFIVLGYKSAHILKKYGKTKISPVFWTVLLFIPIVNIVTAVLILIKNNNLSNSPQSKGAI